MKKTLIGCLVMLLAFWLNSFALWQECSDCLIITDIDENTRDEELSEAIEWMYENWLTIYNTPETFMINDSLTREQASKFFAQFASKVLNKDFTDDTDLDKFSDIEKADSSLTYYIMQANHLWLFQWLDGKFMPHDKLTQSQAITVAIRMLDWNLDENNGYRFKNYFKNANDYWLLKRWDFDITTLDTTNITRWDMALILYTLYKYITNADVFGVMEYNNKLVDIATTCIDSEKNVWDTYKDWSSEELEIAINNTISQCKESIKQLKELWTRNGDDSLLNTVLDYIANNISYYNKMKNLIPYQDIAELSDTEEEIYNTIVEWLDKLSEKSEKYSNKLIEIQNKFAKKYRFELE